MARGAKGAIIRGRRLFRIFPSQGGDYSSLSKNENMFSKNKTKRPRKKRKSDYFRESRTLDLRCVMVITWLGALQFYVYYIKRVTVPLF